MVNGVSESCPAGSGFKDHGSGAAEIAVSPSAADGTVDAPLTWAGAGAGGKLKLSSRSTGAGVVSDSSSAVSAAVIGFDSAASSSKVCLQREQRNAGAAPLTTSSVTL